VQPEAIIGKLPCAVVKFGQGKKVAKVAKTLGITEVMYCG
jgi:hypothetical protein